jgi:hypothetical protein
LPLPIPCHVASESQRSLSFKTPEAYGDKHSLAIDVCRELGSATARIELGDDFDRWRRTAFADSRTGLAKPLAGLCKTALAIFS